jgi:hypothetical protein
VLFTHLFFDKKQEAVALFKENVKKWQIEKMIIKQKSVEKKQHVLNRFLAV